MIFNAAFARTLRVFWKKAKKNLATGFILKYFQWFQANASPGSLAWLALREMKYGGRVKGVPRNQRSSHAPKGYYSYSIHAGGDRMLRHGYGAAYAEYLKPCIGAEKPPVTLAEIGILQGTGLAIWSDLFPSGRIIGLDMI